ncbi:MAG: o-succinylbenzoate synthase [bacterium]
MNLRLKRITMREIAMRLKEPFEISSGIVDTRRILLLELESVDGAAAWSECVADVEPNYFPDTVETSKLAIREWIAPRLLGRAFSRPVEIYDLLETGFRGHPMAKAAVEMGMWGLAAELERLSLAAMLGGARPKVPVGISVGIQAGPEQLTEKVQGYVREGYRKIKLKIKPGKDIAYVRAVRESIGDAVPLMVDANNVYTLDDTAILKQLDAFGLMMIEQPLAWDDLVRHAQLQRVLKTPLCLDESITNVDRAQDMITLHSGTIINIKPGRVGGLTSALRIHNLCKQHNIPVWCGGMLESGIGRAYNVALASLSNFLFPGDISPSARYWERDIVQPPWTMDSEGFITVPRDKPGIGVSIDRDTIEDNTIAKETISAA